MKQNNFSEKFNPSLDKSLITKSFLEYRKNGKIPFKYIFLLFLKALFLDIPISIINNYPGVAGYKIRQFFYKFFLKESGNNFILGEGIKIRFPSNLSISDFAFIDDNVEIESMLGFVKIGSRVHIGKNSTISGTNSSVIIEDYVGIGSFVRIYAHSETIEEGKRMSGPMIDESEKGMLSAPVIIKKDSFISSGSVILPGVVIEEGAVITPNSFIKANSIVKSWTIYGGNPARFLGYRKNISKEK